MLCILNSNNRQALLANDNFSPIDFAGRACKIIPLDRHEITSVNLVKKFPTVIEWRLIATEEDRNVIEQLRVDLHICNKATRLKGNSQDLQSFLKGF